MATGKVWKYKNNINTDIITPPESMELNIHDAAKYCMSNLDPEFASGFKEGDIFVCEHNLGSGSSRETAPLCLKELGVHVVIAMDYARIFYRNCINVGIIALECPDTDKISKDDVLDVDYKSGVIKNLTTNETYHCNPIPDHIFEIVEQGGLISYITNKINSQQA